ncbi:glycosyltransferase [Pirellulales bacterium]|nr:glycosyltransferase [Pirellulales bacterium]
MSVPMPRPWCVQFVVTSMPVGGAETLLLNLIRKMDRRRFAPELICLKEPGPLGTELSAEIPVHSQFIGGKYDMRVWWRLWRLMRRQRPAAVITVAAGDNMFWGRLAAWAARVPVIASALHSTGWPDGVGRLNRMLTPLTDAFIGVADAHAEFLVEFERFPQHKVHTIHNGVDVEGFAPRASASVRERLGIAASAPVVGIVAALRPEKNHALFLEGAQQILRKRGDGKFLIIGDGPEREGLETLAQQLGVAEAVQFLGNRSDVAELLGAFDVLALTSHNEANPVSILEALSSGCPVVASNVGSVSETVVPDETGLLFPKGDVAAYAAAVEQLLASPETCRRLGAEGRRRVVEHWSLEAMTRGYEMLIDEVYAEKTRQPRDYASHLAPMRVR